MARADADPPTSAGPEVASDGTRPGHADEVVARPVEALRRPPAVLAPLVTFGVGFGMGTADLVPGFSGGTVALLCGIYQRLVANVRQGAHALSLLARGRVRAAVGAVGRIEWSFVLALLAGILTAVLTLAQLLESRLEAAPVAMSALFLGLVLGATVVARAELRAPDGRHLVIAVAAAVVTFVGLGFGAGSLDDPGLVVLFLAGAIAICAMILPGVSGSFLLLLVGVYTPVLAAVADRDLLTLAVFGAGCVVGLASFSTLLHWLLRHHHDVVLAALLGLLVGSARVLWPWPSTGGVGDPALGAPTGDVATPAALAIGGAVAVVALGTLARRATRPDRDPA